MADVMWKGWSWVGVTQLQATSPCTSENLVKPQTAASSFNTHSANR